MSNLTRLIVSSFFFALLLLNQAFAQSPEAFKYQAVVRDANYAPIASKAVKVRLSILAGSDIGPIVYQEVHSVTTSSIGLVSLNVGEGTVISGVFANIAWESDKYFILVEVDQLGGTNYQPLGSSQLLSVPYAMFSKVAGTALDKDDADADPINELQDLSLNGHELSITDGNTITLPSLAAGEGISIDTGVVRNIKPSLWQLDSNVVFVDTNVVGIGIPDTFDFPSDAALFVNGNIRMAEDSALLDVGHMVGNAGINFSADSNREGEMKLLSNGRVLFEEEVGINQVFSFIDLNVRNQLGNSTVFQVEDTIGRDLFEVGTSGNTVINRINNNVTHQVRNSPKKMHK